MPKWKAQIEKEKREQAVMLAVARCQIMLKLPYDMQVVDLIGISRSTYCRYKRDKFQRMPKAQFDRMVMSRIMRKINLQSLGGKFSRQ